MIIYHSTNRNTCKYSDNISITVAILLKKVKKNLHQAIFSIRHKFPIQQVLSVQHKFSIQHRNLRERGCRRGNFVGSWLPPIEREAEGGTAPGKDGDSGDGSRRIRGRTSRRHRARPGKNGIAATDEADEGVEVATSEAGEDAVTATGRAETAPVHLAGSEEERGGGNWRGRGRHRATTGRPETTDLTGFREERGGFLGKEDGALPCILLSRVCSSFAHVGKVLGSGRIQPKTKRKGSELDGGAC